MCSDPDDEIPMEFVNLNAFAANLWERRILSDEISWAIDPLREAHENGKEKRIISHELSIMTAAQWIFWSGQSVFKHIQYAVSDSWVEGCYTGPLFGGEAELSLRRWHFWRDGFRAAAAAADGSQFGEECRNMAARSAELMDSLEKTMTF